MKNKYWRGPALQCVYLIYINKGEETRGEEKGNGFSSLWDCFFLQCKLAYKLRYLTLFKNETLPLSMPGRPSFKRMLA